MENETQKAFTFFALLGSCRDEIFIKGFDTLDEYNSYCDGFRDALGWLEAAVTDDLESFHNILDDYAPDTAKKIIEEFKNEFPLVEADNYLEELTEKSWDSDEFIDEKKVNHSFLLHTQCQKGNFDFLSLHGVVRNLPMRITIPVDCLDIVSRDNSTSFPVSHEILSEVSNFTLEGFYNG